MDVFFSMDVFSDGLHPSLMNDHPFGAVWISCIVRRVSCFVHQKIRHHARQVRSWKFPVRRWKFKKSTSRSASSKLGVPRSPFKIRHHARQDRSWKFPVPRSTFKNSASRSASSKLGVPRSTLEVQKFDITQGKIEVGRSPFDVGSSKNRHHARQIVPTLQ